MSRKILVLLGALLLAAAIWRGVPRRAVAAAATLPDPASLALLPQQATALFGMDVEALRSTPMYALWREHVGQGHDSDYRDFVSRSGFDPERDISSMTGALWKENDAPGF